ncbi:translation initiation factor IF-2 [Bosea sp. 62]|uniref:translation initiation factor IF-2 n=1 Tax=unclassified Bosea (in: a-proteobacteria) TaxID=2653178 RepID=UPI00125B5866|nr:MULTISPECIES: translation initiation factor IF-2 [unclassified Bosea (in: a-proteobacteria)]CAD5283727.1 translation initiation factor IF-2 [Bosea sp. 21B]CAD5286490.1 translation initiation factor IF-2 [Bosea sp. 46]CAD5301789.1 translation initiation factor IF-2 [Bosea sp. 7B]VVT51629.1 translation initiation factor IF-2 [Bosea sp. EC-HK365B]VXB16052.1 translation initiation factor IF-2 [Bosea sp. 62]
MSDTKTPGDKTLSVTPPKTLSLKRPVEQSTVRQSFSHGRTKQVVVEVKRRVSGHEPVAAPVARAPQPQQQAPTPPRPQAPQPAPQASRPASSMLLRTLSDDEKDARQRALSDARATEAEARARAEEEARQRAARESRERAEREAAQARQREEEDRRRQEDEHKRRAESAARQRMSEEAAPPRPAPPRDAAPSAAPSVQPYAQTPRPAPSGPRETREFGGPRPPARDVGARPPRLDFRPPRPDSPRPPRPDANATAEPLVARPARQAPSSAGAPRSRPDDGEARPAFRRPGGAPGAPRGAPAPAPKTPKVGEKPRGRLTLSTATGGDDERTRSLASFRRRVQRMTGHRASDVAKERVMREVIIPETITIQELANRMTERGVDVIRLLMKQGAMHKITDVIDADTAQLVAEEMGHTVKRVAESDVEEGLFDTPDTDETLVSRPAVVTIMGHVDHGKTSLLDAIRKTHVVSGEAGGITQHIGAYQVTTPAGAKVTFIDTPGHAAFTAMRARGAKVTDVVVLVVAADDGVMPQTVEAINHAKAAKVPLIVAINKIDKSDANPDRVRSELLQYEIQVESLGGETLEIEVSAKTGQGLDTLLEAIALQAEVLDIKANPERAAEGTVIEAKLDRGRGPVATVLVQRGTLRTGDIVVAGAEWGRVRALISDTGAQIKEAAPSLPVEVLGFNGTPEAGDRVAVVESEARAREITDYRERQKRDRLAARGAGSGAGRSLAEMMRELKEGAGRKEFPLVVKGDVQGSVEAIVGSLEKVGNDEVRARVLSSGVGAITESDVTLAQASGAVVIGFNVRAHKEAREAAERAGVEIRYYSIIYNLMDDVKDAMSGLLAPTLRETMLGNAQILEIFNVSKVGKIAGCRVTDGTIERGANVRLIRDGVVVHEGKLAQLKRFKDDAKEVVAGQECGMSFESYQDMRAGDVIECFRVEEIKRSL